MDDWEEHGMIELRAVITTQQVAVMRRQIIYVCNKDFVRVLDESLCVTELFIMPNSLRATRLPDSSALHPAVNPN